VYCSVFDELTYTRHILHIIDINLSDHLPTIAVCKTDIESKAVNKLGLPSEVTHLRWDHARTDLYYDHSRNLLQPLPDW